MSTKHRKQLQALYATSNSRMQAPGQWAKLPLFWFLLFLSYRCTRRCRDCYAFNQVGDAHPAEMDEGTFSRLLDWICEVWERNNVKVNIVNFLGGEPLLRTDRIRRVMARITNHTDGMQGLVNTNADLVDTVNWDDLEAIQWITVNITDISIPELARRMTIIRERSGVINQTIAVTLDDVNLPRMLDIARFGIENGYRLRYSKNLFRGLDADYNAALLQKYHALCDLLESYVVRGIEVHTTFLLDLLIPLWDLEESPYPCGKRLATIFPDGGVGPCIRNHHFRTGTIFDPNPSGTMQCDRFIFDLARFDLADECQTCKSRTTCQGGCPNDKLMMTGHHAGKSMACSVHREIIPRLRALDHRNN